MLACSLPKSIMAQARLVAAVTGASAFFGPELAAQTPVHNPPIQLVAPVVTTYQTNTPIATAPAAVTAPAPVYAPGVVYAQPAAARIAAPRRSSPPSMSRSSFSERWSANLKVSGRGFRP